MAFFALRKFNALTLAVLLGGLISLAGCDYVFGLFDNNQLSPKEQHLADEMTPSIMAYLDQNLGETGFGGKPFCAYKTLGVDQNGGQIHAYIYLICQEYYLKGAELTKGTGLAMPSALLIEKNGDKYRVVSHEVPDDGAVYSRDVERIFPRNLHRRIFLQPQKNGPILAETEARAKQYFDK